MDLLTPLNIGIYTVIVLLMVMIIVFKAGKNAGWNEAMVIGCRHEPEESAGYLTAAEPSIAEAEEAIALLTGPIELVPAADFAGLVAPLSNGTVLNVEPVLQPSVLIQELQDALSVTKTELSAVTQDRDSKERMRAQWHRLFLVERARLFHTLDLTFKHPRRPTRKAMVAGVITVNGETVTALPAPVIRDWSKPAS